MLFAPIALAMPFGQVDVQVVEVRRHAFVAGRLGKRVVTDLVVKRGDRTYLVHLPAYHSHVGGKPSAASKF